jgi:hypothetical protein
MNTAFAFKKSGAFALIALMASIVVILIVFSGVMYWVTSNGIQLAKNEAFTDSEAAAEGASEIVFAHMDRDYLYGNLASVSNYQADLPSMTGWPQTYNFSVNVNLGPQSQVFQYLGSQYTNLIGEPETNTITVTATPTGQLYNIPATVSQTFVFATVPAFQFAIFYNINLEIDPGSTMPIVGAVFSNGGIWSGTANVTYSSTVEAAGQVSTNGTDPFCSGKTDTGTPRTSFTYSGTPPQPESNVNPLIIPIGASTSTNDTSTNVQAIIQVPPAGVAAPSAVAYQQTNLVYDFNAASLLVTNWYYGTNGVAPWSNNFTAYLQDSVLAPSAVVANNGNATNWVMLTNDYFVVSNRFNGSSKFIYTNWIANFQFTNNWSGIKWTATNGPYLGTNSVWYAGFSFLTNVTFYDYRESAIVDAVQLDVTNLGKWINAMTPNGGSNWNQELCEDLGHGINSIWIDNTSAFIGGSLIPAVRVVNGQLLPSSTCYNITVSGTNYPTVFTRGLTVVTPQPLYVWGNYNVQTNGGPQVLQSHNTANTYPASFLADAITLLSPNWNDTNNASTSINSRTPSNMTLNAACLEGIVPSVGSSYSGGVENFLRLQENWSSSITITYNGSIMVMFTSSYNTNLWPNTGSVYNVPKRDWGFDTNFEVQANLPPLTPQFRAVVRNTWSGY